MAKRINVGICAAFISFLLLVSAVVATGSDANGPQQSTTGPEPPRAVVEMDALKVRAPAALSSTQVVLDVPDYGWRHGCGPTAVGMVVGYYDTQGYIDLIDGNAQTQTDDVNQAITSGGDSSNPNPPGTEEHYEDYSRPEDDPVDGYGDDTGPLADDYIGKRTAHTSNCIGDYMRTSWSTHPLGHNYYGWSWSDDISPSFLSYVNQQNSLYNPSSQEYSSKSGTPLNWTVLTTEINNGRPMVFLVDTDGDNASDHFVTVVGYDSNSPMRYGCLDTWEPVDAVRWQYFWSMGSGKPWGIWGGWSFELESLIVYVNVDSPNDPGTGTIDDPFRRIQYGIDAAIDGGGIVLVADGTYTGTDNRDLDFGGKAITLRSENGADSTIIDCENAARGFYFHTNEGPDSVIDGFTICNGNPSGPASHFGGGIYCGNFSSPTIVNCLISDNHPLWSGGGIYCESGSPRIINCTISGNSAGLTYFGGGIYCVNKSNMTVINCMISANTAGSVGGGFYCEDSSPTLINCIFSGNSSTSSAGGGMANRVLASPTLTNCTFIGNSAYSSRGAGMHSYSECTPVLVNCIFWDNTGLGGPQSIALENYSQLTISYCDTQGGQPAIYKDSTSSITWGSGNIDAAPDFVDANGPDDIIGTDDDNLRLLPESPCVDAGNNTSVPADTVDLDDDGDIVEPIPFDIDGRARFADGDCNDTNVVDMGAYEFGYVYIGDFDYGCSVDFKDFAVMASAWLTEQGQTGYDPVCDISIPADQHIDLRDLDVFTDNWLAGK